MISTIVSYLKPEPKQQYDNEMDRANSVDEQDEVNAVYFADSIKGMKQATDSINDNRGQYENQCELKNVKKSKTLIVDPKEAQKEKNVFVGKWTTFLLEVSAGVLFFMSQKMTFFWSCILACIVALLVNKFLGATFSYSSGVSDKEKAKRAEKVLLIGGIVGAFSFCVIILSRWVLNIESLVALFLGIFFISAAICTIAFSVLEKVYAWAREYSEKHKKFTALFNSWEKVYNSTYLWFSKRPNGKQYLENFLCGKEDLLFSLKLAEARREEKTQRLSDFYNDFQSASENNNSKLRLLQSLFLLFTIGLTQIACDGQKVMNSVKAEITIPEAKEDSHKSGDKKSLQLLRENPVNAIVGIDLSGVVAEAAKVINNRVSQFPEFIIQQNITDLAIYPIQQESFNSVALHNLTFDPFPTPIVPKDVEQTEFNILYGRVAESKKEQNTREAQKQTQELIEKHKEVVEQNLEEIKTLIPLDASSPETDLNGFMQRVIAHCNSVQTKVLVLLITDGGFNTKNSGNRTKTLIKVNTPPNNLEFVVLLLPSRASSGQGANVYSSRREQILQAWPWAKVHIYSTPMSFSQLFTPKMNKNQNS